MPTKNYKITKKEDFNLIYKNGKVFQSDYLKVFVLPNKLALSRFSVIVSKNVSSKAVERNSIKRKIKNIILKLEIQKKSSLDIIIKTHKGIENIKKRDLLEKFKRLLSIIDK